MITSVAWFPFLEPVSRSSPWRRGPTSLLAVLTSFPWRSKSSRLLLLGAVLFAASSLTTPLPCPVSPLPAPAPPPPCELSLPHHPPPTPLILASLASGSPFSPSPESPPSFCPLDTPRTFPYSSPPPLGLPQARVFVPWTSLSASSPSPSSPSSR